VASIRQYDTSDPDGNVSTVSVHLDSHADCCLFSEHSKILYSDISRTVNISPFKADLGVVQGLPVSTIAIAYDDPVRLITYILVFHEVLQIPGMAHHILCVLNSYVIPVSESMIRLLFIQPLKTGTSLPIQLSQMTLLYLSVWKVYIPASHLVSQRIMNWRIPICFPQLR
jgi:hypothetical protein